MKDQLRETLANVEDLLVDAEDDIEDRELRARVIECLEEVEEVLLHLVKIVP